MRLYGGITQLCPIFSGVLRGPIPLHACAVYGAKITHGCRFVPTPLAVDVGPGRMD